jgi:1-acyl-sn-glycerol-3-phosphate acyltransferase
MIEGQKNLSELDNPALIIANHTSHFDSVIALSVLPERVRDRTAIVAAADRMYRERLKGMLHSLRYNAFPITRGGGREALAYSQWLLRNRWSLLVFPEGKRSRSGELLPFHAGPAILALDQTVPVAPICISGAMNILPPGSPKARPAPVTVRIGRPFTFSHTTTIPGARAAMEDAIRVLMQDEPTFTRRMREPVLATR